MQKMKPALKKTLMAVACLSAAPAARLLSPGPYTCDF